MKTNTIAAIATAVSNSGISIIRISGSKAIEIADNIFVSKRGKNKIADAKSHTILYGYIEEQGVTIDEVIVLIMRAPNSYTCEDVVEIHCHGGILVTKKILESLFKNGAIPAEPGEFTKRAFLNGRIDLSQAEAVMDLIKSKSEYALKSSINQLKGSVYTKISNLRREIIRDIAYIEAALDDPEHIDINGFGNDLYDKTKEYINQLEDLLKSASHGKYMKEGIQTVIVGKPNAGKSSLLNILVGHEKAIVTDIEGTTRDIIEETIQLDGVCLNIIDTAGIRNTENVVEKIGVEKAKSYVESADLVLFVMDASRQLDENDYEIIPLLKNKRSIILLNKIDLDSIMLSKSEIEKITEKDVIEISVKEERGVDLLKTYVKQLFFNGEIEFNDQIFITNERQKNAIRDSVESLKQVLVSIENQMPEDFYSIDLMNAYEKLGEITGESVGEDLVNTIFSEFCMGK
ncbi:tRNA uridine-5-carboxymethylaminomethyl(34) synthesis GTPase MnmE [Anaeromicropila populeti]|uniref:tRNA modification GTPase MnmE n=1 Tax=Anaeromicropila populeti TaxID=37658 RepID=A0A1I6LMC8_9FIRM|nr:tRNA uridine-5-carboxymethylaminomethyl(34) synthesis GTPase MnmE [Anaeromicropila populeti]SFS04717.1 tRNA modification GTPase [Anaeromicropila populeti]